MVLTVHADNADYWKAEHLDVFNGQAWVSGAVATGSHCRRRARGGQPLVTDDQGAGRGNAHPRCDRRGFCLPPLTGPAPSARAVGWHLGRTDRRCSPGRQLRRHDRTRRGRARPSCARRSGLPAHRAGRLPVDPPPEAGLPAPPRRSSSFPPFGARRRADAALGGGLAAATPARRWPALPTRPVYALARRLAAGARTPYALAVHILSAICSTATPTTSTRRSGPYPLVSFLFQRQDRLLPAVLRVRWPCCCAWRESRPVSRPASRSGSRPGRNGPFVVTDINAHAWVEVWFPRYGWVRFDPTPPRRPARGGPAARFRSSRPSRARRHRRERPASRPPSDPDRVRRSPTPGRAAARLAADRRRSVARARAGPGARRPVRARRRAPRPACASSSGRWPGPDARSVAAVTLSELEQRFRDSPAAAGYVRALRMARYGGADAPGRPGRRRCGAQLPPGSGSAGVCAPCGPCRRRDA